MKTFGIIVTFVILVNPIKLTGQSLIGAYGGFNSSSFFDRSSTPHYSANYDSKNTYLIGFHLKERKDKLLNITFGIEYQCRNVKIDASYGGLGFWIKRDLNVDIHSLNLRILPEIRIGKKYGAFVNIGPYFGFIIDSQISGIGSSGDIIGNNDSWTESGNAKDDFNGLDFGFSSTLGLEIPITTKLILITDINYGIGLSNISRGSLGSYAEFMNSKNLYITGGLVYKINGFNFTEILKEF